MSIRVIQQNTSERKKETKEFFEKIKPYLDEGYSYLNAVKLVKGINNPKINYSRKHYAWYRDLIEYGESVGYPWDKYSGNNCKKISK